MVAAKANQMFKFTGTLLSEARVTVRVAGKAVLGAALKAAATAAAERVTVKVAAVDVEATAAEAAVVVVRGAGDAVEEEASTRLKVMVFPLLLPRLVSREIGLDLAILPCWRYFRTLFFSHS